MRRRGNSRRPTRDRPVLHRMRVKRARKHRMSPRRRQDAPTVANPHVSDDELWTRDLTEEGIESHPGPKYISKNFNGLNDVRKLERTLKTIQGAHRVKTIQAVFMQEHNLKPDAATAAVKYAHERDLLLLIAPSTAAAKGERP